MRRFKAFFAAALLTLGVVACGGGKIPPTRYYALELPAAPAPQAGASFSAAVVPFRADSMLTQDRIVYRPTKQEVGYYEYHRWAEDPRAAVTNAVIERLRASGAFKNVVIFDGRTQADFVVRGRIERLEEVDYETGVKANVEISAELLDMTTNRAAWTGSASTTRPVAVSEVKAVVTQLSDAVNEAVTKLADGIAEAMKTAKPAAD